MKSGSSVGDFGRSGAFSRAFPSRLIRRARSRLAPKTAPVILMYHHVGAPGTYESGLTIQVERFAAQMRSLVAHRHAVSLAWLVDQMRNGREPQNTVAVTFDDGYADFASVVLPILKQFSVPATLFVVADFVMNGAAFTWARGECKVAGGMTSGAVGRSLLDSPNIYDAAARRSLHEEELRALVENDLIDVGSHSLSHLRMGEVSEDLARQEAGRSASILSSVIGRPVRLFSYPHGSYRQTSSRVLARCGYSCGVTSENGRLYQGIDPYFLPRINVLDWAASEFDKILI